MNKSWFIYIKTVSEANSSEHWTKKNKRHKSQKKFIRLWSLENNIKSTILPCIVRLTRLAPGMLDEDDNLRMAFKWIKDFIADEILPGQAPGRADSDKRITWTYAQEKSPIYAIRIEISSDNELGPPDIFRGDIQQLYPDLRKRS